MNFINLNPTEERPVVLNPISVNIPKEEIQELVLKPIQLDLDIKKEESEGCVQQKCNTLHTCSDQYFAIKNLFSELTDDYQRAIIRQNLGIADDLSLVWGKIGGNLANQEDLYSFVQEVMQKDEDGILTELNLQLKYWTQQIENKIESLASNITSLQIIPKYSLPDQLPINVLVYWEYDQPVEAQAINGITLDPDVREYIFENVTDTKAIRLSYYLNGVWLSRNINFEVTFPIFYGTSDNYAQDNYSIDNKVEVTANEDEYIYILTKNKSDLSVNGIIGGFEEEGFTSISGTRYIIYKSLHPNLGKTVVRIYDSE